MATDPFNDNETKGRLRRSVDATAAPQGFYPMTPGAFNTPPRAAPTVQLRSQRDAEASRPQSPRSEASRPQLRRPEVRLVEPTPPNFENAEERRRAGVTRIVRTAPGVYTDDPYAEGEVRYYGALGDRVDVPQMPSGVSTNTTPEQFYQAQRASAFDVTTPEGAWRAAGNAERQRRTLGRMLADQAAIAAGQDPSNPRGLEWVPDPTNPDRYTVLSREQREAADPALAAARARGQSSGPDLGDLVSLMRLQMDAQNNAANQQLRERALQRMEAESLSRRFRDNPSAFVREELGSLRTAAPEERAAYFSSPRGQFVRSLIDDQARRAYARNVRFMSGLFATPPESVADLQRPSRLARALPVMSPAIGLLGGATPLDAFRSRYVTARDPLQRGVSLEDMGLTPGDAWVLDLLADLDINSGR